MSKSAKGFQRWMIYLLLISFVIFPNLSFSEEGLSELKGKVFASDGSTPVAGSTVRAYHIASGKIYNSKPTDASGSYLLSRLPYGYYDLAVETKDGLFVSTQAINVAPNTKLNVSFSLTAFDERPEWWEGKEKPQIPAMQEESSGIAKILEKKGPKAFWKSGKGVATILVSSAVVIGLAAAGGGDDGGAASPIVSP
jgi:hypothetical protein